MRRTEKAKEKKRESLEKLPGDETARKRTWAVLQVLSGHLGASEAAKSIGVSGARYYQLEKKALSGMLAFLSPSEEGQKPAPKRLEKLQKRVEELQEETARQKQLLRMARRVWGLSLIHI